MESEDFIKLPDSCNSGYDGGNDDERPSGGEATEANSAAKEEFDGDSAQAIPDGPVESVCEDIEMDIDDDAVNDTPAVTVGPDMTEPVAVVDTTTYLCSENPGNQFLSTESGSTLNNLTTNGTLLSSHKTDTGPLSGSKRLRVTLDEQQPSVHVIYNSLTRESKRKLEELLQQWSRWHAQNCSRKDSNVVPESGEETFFPAVQVGLNTASAVSFWVDNQKKVESSIEFTPPDSVPLYDREYSLALTLDDGTSNLDGVEKLSTSRCFNCGSYSHSLRDCPKPRDNFAISNARKHHKSRRNQQASSRNSTRYYQNSLPGKYDGLVPGVLDPETRQLLGLGELDPPPWLNRMREIGYPPGYMDPDEDNPSGITIFGDEANEEEKEENEEGEILDASHKEPARKPIVEPPRKMSVEFPGINAPIPVNADERLWSAGSSSFNMPRDYSHRRYNHESENSSRGRHHESENSSRGRHQESRWSTELDDERPPGCDPWTSPSLSNHYRRYGDYSHDYTSSSPRASPSTPWSASLGRSLSSRGRRSPQAQDDYQNYGQYGNSHSSPR